MQQESHRGLERRLPLLGSLAYLLVLRGVVSVRLHLDDVGSIQELARRWNNFEGSEIWGLRYVDCMAMEGILCDKDGFVTDIVLQQKGFYAPIPTMISKLQHLRHLSLMFCTLTGTIPDSLFNLTSLSVLDVVGNFITGTVPVGISRLVNLRVLGLGLNQLSGPLDPLSNLPQLIFLHLDQNLFNGSISSELGKLTTLRFLSLKENEFSASIPSSLGNLASLNELTLSVNQLSGTIPDSLSGLHSLTNLNLHTNQLTGAIPESLGALSALKFLELQYNRLNGSIPATLSSLQQLEWLMISGNLLSGSIPAALGDIPLLKYMWLALNQLSGSIPTAIGKLANLVNLDMWNNQLCGTIPTTLHNLSKVQYLALSYNQLSGPVEPIIRGMRSVTDLWSAAECAAFCGLEVGATGPVCGGHGYCLVNPSTGASECVCDPNYMLSSSNSNACVPGAAETFLVSASAYVSLRGSASVLSNGSILLTNGAANQQGAAFGSPAMRLFYFPDKRSRCGTELGFLAAFSFAMSPGGQGEGGEGLAFVVAAGASEKGASVGLGGVGRRSMGVEFDSVLSVKHSDPNDNHVGVNVGGSPVSLASATAPLILNDAQTKHAWIHYDPTSGGTLQVFLSSDPVQPLTPTLTASVSLCSVLKPTASDSLFLFGFLALSSTAPQRLGILSWNFTGVSPVG
ncbi:hypothetical protein CLOM_g1633 [Closterium sp. NIES-68]|nr:hypothetical protein CLOM_g1633 [Closterium sp. NIES-68]GJP71085.1 hypothetical protein CLOP_g1944 [Closterium sp. NIES-67]